MSYRVTAPYVTAPVRDEATGTETVHGFYEGAVLPANVNTEAADRLAAKGMVEKTSAPAPKPASPASQEPSGDRPAGNASREAWAAYATGKGAPETETVPVEDGGLSRDDLRAKYGA